MDLGFGFAAPPLVDQLGYPASLLFLDEGLEEGFDFFEVVVCLLWSIRVGDGEHGFDGGHLLKLLLRLLFDVGEVRISFGEDFAMFG